MLSLFAKHRSQQWEPKATTVRAFRGVWPVQVLSSLVWYSSNVESIYWEHSPPLLTFEAWLFQCKQVKAIGTKDHALMRQDALNTCRAVVEAVKASAWTKWLSEFIIVYIYYVWSEWLSTKSLYKPIYVSSNFVVKSVTSLNSLMSTESFACDQNRTARTYYRLRTASLHFCVEVIAPVYCQPEDAQWKDTARNCLHHVAPILHRTTQHHKVLATAKCCKDQSSI